MKPQYVAQIHRAICARAKCEHLETLNYSDPCASCPNGHWGVYSLKLCDDPGRVIATQPAIPSKLTMAKSAAGALGAVMKHGIAKVSDEEQARRLEICNGCEFLIRQPGSDRCGKCGCYLNWKSRLAAWHCPIGKW